MPRQIFSNKDKITYPLYRFTKQRYLETFFASGQLRLGTLFDYAVRENYGDAVHDRHEGYCVFRSSRPVTADGVGAIEMTLAQNNLLLCLTDSYDPAMYGHFEADACLSINSVEFFQCIDEVLRSEFTELLLRKVVYIDKSSWNDMPASRDFAGVVKDKKFAYQREVRALWEPRKPHTVIGPSGDTPTRITTATTRLIDVNEGSWFSKYAHEECEWLSPKEVFVPDARQFCSVVPRA